ncbi:MAG: DEAD/DEAH box helicase [Candidatus Lokiarchaeota archaeon]|nr:DEAD/DEAH box helicase [Candidatus Lokiarchaeota archaeon]
MKVIQKDFFIVINRDLKNKVENKYNVNFFYIKSLNKLKKKSFSYVSKPFFNGIIILGLDFKNKLCTLKFDKISPDGVINPIDPKLFKKFLLSDYNRYVAFSSLDSLELQPFFEMLNNLQFEKEKIIKLTFCEYCLEKRDFKILNKGNQIRSLNNQIICSRCAMDIILHRAEIRNLFSASKLNPKLKNFFTHLILKFKDVKKVIETFKPDFNPIKNENITLYDIEKEIPVSKKYLNINIEDLELSDPFKKNLRKNNIKTLLPIQAISIDNGLISEKSNQLIMAPTSGGKTLIGELAGINKLIENPTSKMLYLVPIVALANIRDLEFKKKYSDLKLRIMKKVGESLLEKKDNEKIEDLNQANVIVATYEAIDYILRSGNKEVLGNISTIIIDEIQTLIDPERGFLLDGFIARLKIIFDNAQYLYLSATIGEPEILANKLASKLIRYRNRPVPIERHLLLCQNDNIKLNYIFTLTKEAFSKKSKYGYKGQTIIFTHARKKCESIAKNLRNKGLNIRSYHSGLTNEERKIIEFEFQSQKIAGVVSTAALAAGVDLPASQVIFESLAMGIKWLTVADFEQMLGRAGRLKKHELGKIYLLVQPEKIYNPRMDTSEENIAIRLLNGKIKDFELEPNEDRSLTELLAFISVYPNGVSKDQLNTFYKYLINSDYELNILINMLFDKKLIQKWEEDKLKCFKLGNAIAKSFITIEKSIEIINMIKKRTYSIKEIVLNLKSLRNIYMSKSTVADLSKNVNMKYFSNNFFSASILSLMDAEYVKKRKKFSQEFINLVIKWTNDIFICSCKDKPYCECGRLNLEKIILELRTIDNFSIQEIHNYLEENYSILIFKGDLIDYFDNLIYSFESIKNMVEGITNLEESYKKELLEIPLIIENIKG